MVRTLMLSVLLAGAAFSSADEITLKNGDRLTGTVLTLDGGNLRVKTDHSGLLKVNWKEVFPSKPKAPSRLR